LKAAAIIKEVVNAGGGLTVAGDRLHYRLPKNYPEKQRILHELREHKPEIVRLLSSRPQTCASSCYEVEPGTWSHRPWDGCQTCLVAQPKKPARKVESACWHCDGDRACRCSTCWNPATRERADCTVCKGTGQVWQWLQ